MKEQPQSLPPDWKPKYGIFLTVGKDRKGRGWLAIISDGQPRKTPEALILDLELLPRRKDASAWYKKAMKEKKWITRQ